MEPIISKMNEGGPVIMYTIFILLVLILLLFVRGIIKKETGEKTRQIIISIAWFAVAWGFLGRTIGLIGAFDTIQAAGQLTPEMVSGGLKMALLGPLFGVLVFAIARVAVIILLFLQREVKAN